MPTSLGRFLSAAIHQGVIVAVFVVVCALMAFGRGDATSEVVGSDDPDHIRNCLMCRSGYRYAREGAVAERSADGVDRNPTALFASRRP